MGEEEQPSPEAGSPDVEKEHLQVPFPVLHGECVEYVEKTEEVVIALSSYRLHIKFKDNIVNVPLQLIECVECRDLTQLHLTCKDCKIIRCEFSSSEQTQDWLRRLTAALRPPTRLDELFAFAFHTCSASVPAEQDLHNEICHTGTGEHVRNRFKYEVCRMGFSTHSAWRISDINNNYRLCASYPEKVLVPSWVTDTELENVAAFRSWKRIPAVVYRHESTGAVIGRCGQPEVSWWGWRNADDENLVQSIAKACGMDPAAVKHQSNGSCVHSSSDPDITNGNEEVEPNSPPPQKLLILDARSYAAAVANRAKGGGCECPEYYPNCEVMFMGMANIHSIRRSFQCLRALCAQVPDPANWLSALEGTKWLQHLSLLLKASLLVVNAVDRDSRPVLVHCSDGWDRTPQIVALSKLLLDPYYRTIEGFQVLVETEWLDFGHKFADRCGHGENAEDVNERCPVFLQWLDCVHQLQRQFPCSFQFNEAFLVKLVQHTYSCLFGTFLCNSGKEREERGVLENTCSVWSLLQPANRAFHNILYSPHSETVLHPVCHVRNLMLWSAVYLPNSAPSLLCEESCASYSTASASPEDTPPGRLPKTRSYDHLLTACEGTNLLASNRRCSDPNLNETWQEHLRSEARTAETQPEENLEQAACCNTHHPEMTGLDERLPNEGLLNRVEHADSKIENGIILANQGGDSSPVVSTPSLAELSNDVPEQNGEDSVFDEMIKHSAGESVTSVGSTSPHPGHVTNGQESLSAKEPLCLANNLKSHPASPQEDCTEPLNTPSPLHSPSQPLSPKPNINSSVCNSEDHRINGSVSQKSLSRQTSTASAGSLQLGCPGRVPAQGAHLGEDGLSMHRDAVQVRLRQMEAGHQLQVETLKRQVQALWNKLHVSGELTPVPDGENNVEAVHLSRCGTELFSESSWENEEQHDKQVPRWYPDHLPTHCYRCESKFWLAARKQQCSAREPVEEAWNCGNVFCASCCDHKATSQQLYEPNRVCQACYGHLRPSAVPPVLPPADLELEKPITASSN
ncbi:myotubularin-related protein 4 isoform X1 [Pangasianodon hypophthalmus]|uniref:myotubularin-related protein 4 isoform X1 n=1 Tax=Pangasianodon hypophthalmus TaxID=310915 RepID=UPI002307EBC1|nr:myotubularin-related protein 4 isoform X1 [Pangasianodon hypophthalmus]XP_053086200.1 myotubularin-related protein 4 isoform X1 [Pangasianodon hypophthalmus]